MIESIIRTLSLPVAILAVSLVAHAQTSVQAAVIPVELNVRAAPGKTSSILGRFRQGTLLNIAGREDQPGDGLWVYATPADGGISGWVRADFLTFGPDFNVESLPVVSAPGQGIPAQSSGGAPAAVTVTHLNFRAGPGVTFEIIRQLPAGTVVGLTGRSPDGIWLQGAADGQTGWLHSGYVHVSGDANALPVVDAAASAPASGGPYIPGVVSGIGPRARQIYVAGQQMGNRRGVFSKVGDSITATPLFLTPIGDGGAHLYDYAYLQPVLDFYMETGARTHNSFGNSSLAAWPGWTSRDLLDPGKSLSPDCQGATPLVCEYRLVKPAVALIMIGTNDIILGVSPSQYRANLETIVQTSIDMGVIPVVSTIPDNRMASGGVGGYNDVVTQVAQSYQIPLWNYWLAMQGLPNSGLSVDGVHPSAGPNETGVFSVDDLRYGYNLRNLTALMALDAVWRGALY